jgi:apolipoprotein N-acyltransferase
MGRAGASVRVAALQPGLTNNGRSPAAHQAANAAVLRRLTTDTRRAAADGAKLVVWPEKALVDFDPHTDDTLALQRLVRDTGAYLVIAYTPDAARYNRATVLAPDGQFIAEYDKQHAVSFQADHTIGGPVSVAPTAIGRLAPIICYDLDFDDTARSAARAHAELLAVPSLDWSGIAELHYSHLVFRAVEDRLAAVKADAAWDSVIVDPEGRIVRSHVTREASRAVLVATVPLGTGHSPFVAVGDVVAWASVVMACAWLGIGSGLWAAFRRRGSRGWAARR